MQGREVFVFYTVYHFKIKYSFGLNNSGISKTNVLREPEQVNSSLINVCLHELKKLDLLIGFATHKFRDPGHTWSGTLEARSICLK